MPQMSEGWANRWNIWNELLCCYNADTVPGQHHTY